MNNSIREPLVPRRRLTDNEKRSFLAAWGGWTMDGMDGFIYALVLVPALRDLLPKSGIPATSANVAFYGGLLFALFMIGWGVALVWGPIALLLAWPSQKRSKSSGARCFLSHVVRNRLKA